MDALKICRIKYLSLVAKKFLCKYFYYWKFRHSVGYIKKVTYSKKNLKHSDSIDPCSQEKKLYSYKSYNSLTNSPIQSELSPAKMPILKLTHSELKYPHCSSMFDELKATLKNKATNFDTSSTLDIKKKTGQIYAECS